MVVEWDSVEQKNADFNQESNFRETALNEHEKKLDVLQATNEAKEHRLIEWSHRLADNKRRLSVMQANLSKECSQLRARASQLNAEKGRIVRTGLNLSKQKSRLDHKDRAIRKLTGEFISVMQDSK